MLNITIIPISLQQMCILSFLQDLLLICLSINLDDRCVRGEAKVESRSSIRNAHHMIASEIPTLQCLSFAPSEQRGYCEAWWRVTPSRRAKGDPYHLQRLSKDQGARVEVARLWEMDAESLTKSDIDVFNACR